MDKTLTLAVCSFLVPEVSQVIASGDYPDVNLVSFPASCTANHGSSTLFEKIIADAKLKDSDLIILGSTCFSTSNSINENSRVRLISLKQCFEIFINSDSIFHFISKGYYIASNGWLKSYNQHISNWGFEKDMARTFFNESMKGILFLDTKIPGDYKPNLEALSEYMNLSYEVLPIGLTFCKMYIDSIVLKWRIENERKSLNKRISFATKQSADYSVIFNQLETLVNLTDEKKIINVGMELINILFAPSFIKYKI
jgi:hypothetical protein